MRGQIDQQITSDGTRVSLSELIALRHEAKRLNMTPSGKVLATRSGGHLSRFRGRGMEFDEARVYQPGDDPRSMDWRVTARSGRPHVKLFREERERPVWLLVDRGASMRFGTRVAFKSVIVARAAALLAWAAADQGDRVGGLAFDETRSYQRQPAVGNRGVLPLLKALSQDPLPGSDSGYGSISRAAQFLLGSVRPGSLVFLLSDFAGLDALNSPWLTQLARGNEVVLIHTFDPLEAAPPPPGRYPVTDGVHHGHVDAASDPLRTGWSRRFSEHIDTLDTLSRRHRTHLINLRTDQSLCDVLCEGLGRRQSLGRRA